MTSSALEQLRADIEEFAAEYVGNAAYHPVLPPSAKIIHDPVWKTIRLWPWEVAVLNLPLLQRLRQISQTSLTNYIFPGSTHTRFEHTLGVIHHAQRLIDATNDGNAEPFSVDTTRNLRLAALLHDCGHCCFSHLSESIYEAYPDMRAVLGGDEYRENRPKGHELFSSLIVQSAAFRKFAKELEARYVEAGLKIDIDRIANWVIGRSLPGEEDKVFERQVIYGPFDADKLDYILRDSHYSGLPMGLDLDRLWAACREGRLETGERVLTLHQASVAPLEQILFSKTNLFSVVYQHPKVRAAERMVEAVFEHIHNTETEEIRGLGKTVRLQKASDFLWITDDVFFAEAIRRPQDDPVHKMIHAIRYRRMLVRALTISKDTVADVTKYRRVRKLNNKTESMSEEKRKLAALICKEVGDDRLTPADVWIDIPGDPSYGEADQTYVRLPISSGANTSTGKDHKFKTLSDFFPINYWNELFKNHRWRGHVFCPQEWQQKVHNAAVKVLERVYGVGFNDLAGHLSHVPVPLVTGDCSGRPVADGKMGGLVAEPETGKALTREEP